MPFQIVVGGHENVVVLHELPEREEDLADIHDLLHPPLIRHELRHRVGLDQVPAVQQQDRPLQLIAWGDRPCLPRPLDLYLRAYRQKAVQGIHSGGIEGNGRQACGPSPAIAEPETSWTGGVPDHRPTGHDVLQVLVVRGHLCILLLARTPLPSEVLTDEVPALQPQLPHVLLQLGGLEA